MCHSSVFQFFSHGHNETCRTFRRSVYLFTHIAFSAAVTESDQRILQITIFPNRFYCIVAMPDRACLQLDIISYNINFPRISRRFLE